MSNPKKDLIFVKIGDGRKKIVVLGVSELGKKEIGQIVDGFFPGEKYLLLTDDQRFLPATFDPAIRKLRENHDWEQHPFVALSKMEVDKKEVVLARWKERGLDGGCFVEKVGTVGFIHLSAIS